MTAARVVPPPPPPEPVYHLPAIIFRDGGELSRVMASACGRRGPIRVREHGVGVQRHQREMFEAGRQCPECEVAWDADEEAGKLFVGWVTTGLRQWAVAGTVVWSARPVPYRCRKCGREYGTSFAPDCLALVVRRGSPRARHPWNALEGA